MLSYQHDAETKPKATFELTSLADGSNGGPIDLIQLNENRRFQ